MLPDHSPLADAPSPGATETCRGLHAPLVQAGLSREENRAEEPVANGWLSGRAALFVLLIVHGALLAWEAGTDSPTNDEPFHLAGGIRRVQEGFFDIDRGTPLSSSVAAIPCVLLGAKTDWSGAPDSFAVGRDFINANGARSFWLTTVGRWACIPFSLLGCSVCWLWARQLNGPMAGSLAAAIWAFCPNTLAHGHLITGDMAATSLGVAALYLFWKWLLEPDLGLAIGSGLMLGAALLAKHVMIVLAALYPVVWVFWTLSESGTTRRERLGQFLQLGALAAATLWFLNSMFLFQGTGQPLERYEFGRKLLGTAATGAHSAPAGLRASLGRIPVPLPEDYLLAIDEINHIYATRQKQSYLNGERKRGGWWYYYLYAIAVKTPLGTLTLLALAALLSIRWWNPISAGLRNELFLLLPVFIIIDFVTLATSIHAHVRYVLPAYPFAVVWLTKVARPELMRNHVITALTGGSLIATIAASLSVAPHSLSFFNQIAGGPRNGHAHLLESNIDWGQDLLHLKKWLAAHPEAKPLHLVYQGLVDPRIAGIDSEPVPQYQGYGGEALNIPDEQLGPQPGWHAVCIQQLRSRPYEYFLRMAPKALAGYSFYIYDVSCEEANRVRQKLGLRPLKCDSKSSPARSH